MTRKKRYYKRLVKYIIGLAVAALSVQVIYGDSRIIDGDTIKVGIERIRLEGIDAPETDQTCKCSGKTVYCGREATTALVEYVGKDEIFCETEKRDRYGRLVGECFINRNGNKINLNKWMVANGYAVAYIQYSRRFAAEEKKAKRESLGFWACERFEEPAQYRQKKREKRQKNARLQRKIKAKTNVKYSLFPMKFQQFSDEQKIWMMRCVWNKRSCRKSLKRSSLMSNVKPKHSHLKSGKHRSLT